MSGEEATDEWVPMQSRTQGRPYYYHTETRETTWDRPKDYDEDLPDDAPGWIEMESRSQGRYYYYNQNTKECVWDRPAAVAEPPPFERPKRNPRREALREVISEWADEFAQANGREPTEEDIPEGSDIARHHRDYRMLKQEDEAERLRKEQKGLREELDPDSRERLIEIKKALEELEPKVEAWKKTKTEERARRDVVTTKYNAWIKSFTEEHGRGPTEKDIDPGSEIEGMFQEYTKYRKEAHRHKQRQARMEEKEKRKKHDDDHRQIRQYMSDFEKKHGRWPTQRDLPKGSEIEGLYARYLEGEMEMNPDSPRARREKLRREITEWSAAFERDQGRRPTRRDIAPGSAIARLYDEYDRLSERKGSGAGQRRGSGPAQQPRAGGGGRGARAEEGREGSPRSAAQYQRERNKPQQQSPGCADCCSLM